MKQIIFMALVITMSLSFSESALAASYSDGEKGIYFEYPDALDVKVHDGSYEGFRVAFSKGRVPKYIDVIFNVVNGAGDLDKFIEKEKREQVNAGYAHQVKENKYRLSDGSLGVEFIRDARWGTLYYFVFASPKFDKLYSFSHMTSNSLDPNRKIVEAYQQMKSSLNLSQ